MNPVTAAVIILSAVVLTSALMLVARRNGRSGGRFSDSDRASGPFGFVGVGFVILLGFIIALSFGTYDNAATQSEAEAVAVVNQFTTAEEMPAPLRDRAQADLVCYARSVVGPDWEAMKNGTGSAFTEKWITAIEQTGIALPADNSKETEALKSWDEATDQRELGRRARLLVAQGEVPPLLWVLLVIAGLMVVGYVLLYADPDEGVLAQVTMMASTAALVAASLVAVAVLASPFRNEQGSIKPTGMQYSLSVIKSDLAAERRTLPILCNSSGMPIR
jgi:phosphatidylglycerophosphate synthase